MKVSRVGELSDAILCSSRVAKLVAGPLLFKECLKIDTRNATRGSFKASFNNLAIKPHRFEDLRTFVGLEG